jgi:hypothetical protein
MNMRISPRYAPCPDRWARSSRRAGTAMLAAIAPVLTALVAGFAAPRAMAATCGMTNTALHQPATASSMPGTTWSASNATDGIVSMRWSSACSDPTRSISNTLTIKNPGNQIWIVGVPVHLQIQASDPGQALDFSAVGLPAGLSISTTGLISGIPTTAGVGDAAVLVTDTSGMSGPISFGWTVVNPQATG